MKKQTLIVGAVRGMASRSALPVVLGIGLLASLPAFADGPSSESPTAQDGVRVITVAQGASPEVDVVTPAKAAPLKSGLSSKLLLPYYRVDTTNGGGDTTLFAVRNESLEEITLNVHYYEADGPQAPQRTDTVMISSKRVYPINVRDIPLLETDEAGIAEGYVVFEVMGGGRSISGDYFQATPGDAFAVGERLVDISTTEANQLCAAFSTRFLSGGAFSGGTRITYWLEADALPLDPGVFSYSIYNEGGTLIINNTVPLIAVAGQIDVDQLLGPFAGTVAAGAVEIEFSQTVGFVTGTMSASGLFSVGMNGLCRN